MENKEIGILSGQSSGTYPGLSQQPAFKADKRISEKNIITRPDLVVVCIGSDRVTGDSLGPLVGYKLEKQNLTGIHIYGTLDRPVHALNLQETVDNLTTAHPDAFIIAIDASLGNDDHVGYITVGKGSLHPGAGVHKNLPPVGNLFITGIVDASGSADQLALHTTRLSSVMNLADCIVSGIIQFHNLYIPKDAVLHNL